MELKMATCLNKRDEQGRIIVTSAITGKETARLTDEQVAELFRAPEKRRPASKLSPWS